MKVVTVGSDGTIRIEDLPAGSGIEALLREANAAAVAQEQISRNEANRLRQELAEARKEIERLRRCECDLCRAKRSEDRYWGPG